MKQRLIFATGNEHKMKEIREILDESKYPVQMLHRKAGRCTRPKLTSSVWKSPSVPELSEPTKCSRPRKRWKVRELSN